MSSRRTASAFVVGQCECTRASRPWSPNHLDSQAFAFPGRCERSERVPERTLRTGSQTAPHAEPFMAVHQEVGRHQFTKASRDHPRGFSLFSQRSRASAALRSRARDSCPHRRVHALPVAGRGVERSCSLSRRFGERARGLVYSSPRLTLVTVEGRFTVQPGHRQRAILAVLSGSQFHDICACLRHRVGVKGCPTESTGEPP